ncbi:reverse transcriptase [Elysia marginata]|uniref:Reverse transcriptase n=1 Tax=Elysia marginata TaxID=1093978 RepID=A0AAV4GMK0_9GAST|nr:reverse transcriptase [Elysia marginata]
MIWKFQQIFQNGIDTPMSSGEPQIKPVIVIHSPSTQQFIMVELTVPYESRMEQAHPYKKEKYLDLTTELKESGHRAKIIAKRSAPEDLRDHQLTIF